LLLAGAYPVAEVESNIGEILGTLEEVVKVDVRANSAVAHEKPFVGEQQMQAIVKN